MLSLHRLISRLFSLIINVTFIIQLKTTQWSTCSTACLDIFTNALHLRDASSISVLTVVFWVKLGQPIPLLFSASTCSEENFWGEWPDTLELRFYVPHDTEQVILEPISWLCAEETKPNTTKASNPEKIILHKMWSKNFAKRLASHVMPLLRVNDPFCCVHQAETPNAFQWARQPQKLPLLMGDLDPI